MNTTLSHSTTHPPDIQDRKVLHIPDPDELRSLALADRLSLRIGIWLLERSRHPRRPRRVAPLPAEDVLLIERRGRSAAEINALLVFDLQRHIR